MWLSLVLEMISGLLGNILQDRPIPRLPRPEAHVLPLRSDPKEDLEATWWE